jgi:hypothetical protein
MVSPFALQSIFYALPILLLFYRIILKTQKSKVDGRGVLKDKDIAFQRLFRYSYQSLRVTVRKK